MVLLDSGSRREFESGAVRDMAEGKGRCDLLPLEVLAGLLGISNPEFSEIIRNIGYFQEEGNILHLGVALKLMSMYFFGEKESPTPLRGKLASMLLETAIHFEDGAKKYDDNNWKKGIPTSVFVDSAVRHLLKLMRGDTDEPHKRAVCWNLMCAIWTCENKPELNSYRKGDN